MISKCTDCFCTSTFDIIRNLFIVSMFCASCVYAAYGILYMHNYKHVFDSCNISHLWYYIGVCIIHNLLRNTYVCCAKHDKKLATAICCVGCCLLIEILFAGWGFLELYAIPDISYINSTEIAININKTACSNIKYTNLWNLGVVSMVIQMVFGTMFLTTLIYILYKYCC